MTPEQHAKAKELFLQARQLSAESREQFLLRECGQDDTIRQEVTSLLKFDFAETIVAPGSRTLVETPLRIARAGGRLRTRGRLLSRIERTASEILQRLFGSPAKRLIVVLVGALLLLGIAVWTHAGMIHATESIAASELQTILNADVMALEFWIEEKKKDIQLLSARSEVREAVGELVRIAETGNDLPEQLRRAPARTKLQQVSDSFDRIVGRPERDAVLNRDGVVLAAGGNEAAIGVDRLNNDGIAALVPVFQGETLFLKPSPDGAFGVHQVVDLNTPMVYVVGPIRREASQDSEIIAAAAFGFPADDEFTTILSVARQGETGETYAFDAQGTLLSESRFDPQLREIGLLPEDPDARSIFRIEIRDPGRRLSARRVTSLEVAAWPLTRLAADAIAAGRKGGESQRQGVILEPYRNYRGVPVIGAWRWLPAYSMGVATEVEIAEQYAPMRFPLIAEWIRFGLLASCIVALLAAAGWIAVLGRDVQEATQLGQYTLQEQIGEGGMGIVYRAQHVLLRRPTAIKLLRPEIVNDASLARFEREVQIASGLTHPNTIEVFDFGETPDGSFYCVMEFLKGRTLDEVVHAEGPLNAERAVRLLRQVAGSLNEAHRRGLIHRDIKPANIMLCEQGGIPDFIKVLDFGLARTIERLGENDVTQSELVMGTPNFLAPERITDPLQIDPRSDVYAVGAVGYFLVTARPIYEAGNPVELIRQIVAQNPLRPSDATDNVIPKELEDLIVSCLQRRPEARPPTMQDVLDRLASIESSRDH